jgi:hypothetical protein
MLVHGGRTAKKSSSGVTPISAPVDIISSVVIIPTSFAVVLCLLSIAHANVVLMKPAVASTKIENKHQLCSWVDA